MAVKKLNLKDKLDGDELDLSLLTLTEIPVAEIAAIPKAKKIDLSNNELVSMPLSFAKSLTNITSLELGCNKLKELPSNLGNLLNLKHLDLYNNQLTELPTSLSKLKNLRYLDLKGNPLNPQLAKEAGNCLNSKECQVAAKRVLAYLSKLKSEKTQQEIMKQMKEKEKENARLRREEEELAKKRAEKKAAKEKRRTELEAKESKISQNGSVAQNGKTQKKKEVIKKNNTVKESKPAKKVPAGWSLLAIVNIFLLIGALFAAATCLALYAEGDLSMQGLKAAWPRVEHNSMLLFNMTRDALNIENIQSRTKVMWKTIQPYWSKAQDMLIIGFNTMKSMTYRAFSSVQDITWDLSPYLQGLKPLWNNFIKAVLWLVRQIMDAIELINWSYLIDGVRWTFQFFIEQFLVIKEELCKNEAIISIWKDLEPIRQSLWDNTLTIRQTLCKFYHEIEITWYPILKEQSDYFYNYIKKSLGVAPN